MKRICLIVAGGPEDILRNVFPLDLGKWLVHFPIGRNDADANDPRKPLVRHPPSRLRQRHTWPVQRRTDFHTIRPKWVQRILEVGQSEPVYGLRTLLDQIA